MILPGKKNQQSQGWQRRLAGSAIGCVLLFAVLFFVVLFFWGMPGFSVQMSQSSQPAISDLRNQVHLDVHVYVAKITFFPSATDRQMNLVAFEQEIESLKDLPVDGWLDDVQERVRTFWQRFGFLKADVNADSKLQSAGHGEKVFSVKATIHAGAQYRLKTLRFVGAKVLSAAALEGMMEIKPGAIFNVTQIRHGLDAIRSAYIAKGYKQFLIDPSAGIDDSEHRVAMTFLIDEGPQSE